MRFNNLLTCLSLIDSISAASTCVNSLSSTFCITCNLFNSFCRIMITSLSGIVSSFYKKNTIPLIIRTFSLCRNRTFLRCYDTYTKLNIQRQVLSLYQKEIDLLNGTRYNSLCDLSVDRGRIRIRHGDIMDVQ
ncbi:hypothetical protein MBAV_002719 [Candidatus Magnetobacterium bavaricum]|uniref:Uncharacterized protein n=1 Tax=Candidatus Magnetobacterium bavaricum TaxID=29290 RepID=A0A0F3GTC2_9BACT|nr:hypothetical protein MBAV_002717 [Candidatus Magnetobacterium bavaricum]KJU85089.1 hypothetical protein MBAV_002719 [Candidatus Magnetobacterium bavaricum]